MSAHEKISEQIKSLEENYWQAMMDSDVDAAKSLTDFPCLIAGESGVRLVDEAEFERLFRSAPGMVQSFEFLEDPEVRVLSADTAVVAYRMESSTEDQGIEKRRQAVDASTWVKRDGQWRCALHTEAKFHSSAE